MANRVDYDRDGIWDDNDMHDLDWIGGYWDDDAATDVDWDDVARGDFE